MPKTGLREYTKIRLGMTGFNKPIGDNRIRRGLFKMYDYVWFYMLMNVLLFDWQEMYYDDDSTQPGSGTLERMTHQIKEVVDEVHEILEGKSGSTVKMDKNMAKEIEQ